MRWGHFSLCSLLLGMPRRQLVKMHGDIETLEPLGIGSWEVRWFLRPAGRVQKKTAGSRSESRTRDLPRQRAQFKRLAELGSGRIVEPEVKPSPARPQRHLQASPRAGGTNATSDKVVHAFPGGDVACTSDGSMKSGQSTTSRLEVWNLPRVRCSEGATHGR